MSTIKHKQYIIRNVFVITDGIDKRLNKSIANAGKYEAKRI